MNIKKRNKIPPPLNSGDRTTDVANLFLLLGNATIVLAQHTLSCLMLAANGTYVEVGLLRSGETKRSYRLLRGGHALTGLARFGDTIVVAGTPGITQNPAFGTVMNFLLALMSMAKRAATFLSPASGNTAYYVRLANGAIKQVMAWNSNSMSIVADGAHNIKGLLARIAGTNRVYFLSADQIAKGRVGERYWTRANVPGITSIDSMPAVIDNTGDVFCRVTTEDGRIGATNLDMTKVEHGTIENAGFEATSETAWPIGRTADGNVVVEAKPGSETFDPGVSVVTPQEFGNAFGNTGRNYVDSQQAQA